MSDDYMENFINNKVESEDTATAGASPNAADASADASTDNSTDAPDAPPSPDAGAAPAPASEEDLKLVEAAVKVLEAIYDPEIPVNIFELGLIYDIKPKNGNELHIEMTLTSPMCPVAESLPIEIEAKLSLIEGVERVTLELVWEPTWTPHMMSEAAKLELGFL